MVNHRLQALLDAHTDVAPGILLSVNAPFHDNGLLWRGSAGQARREPPVELRVDHAFRIASMSKTFTGLLCAQLEEAGTLDLTTPATELLPKPIAQAMLACDVPRASTVTVEQLLLHRAGFHDFALSAQWFAELQRDPGRFRAPEEIAAWALAHTRAVAEPGESYHYSDTGYVLVGLILEQVSGISYAELCSRYLFAPLGMNETWLEGHEEPRAELAHCYLDMDGSYVDALQVNGSCDWAAGGHVSTLADIDRFLRGAFSGRLTQKEATLTRWLRGGLAKPGFHYGLGVGRKVLQGKHLWGHLGHWGSFMYWCPEERMSLCGTLSFDGAAHNEFISAVLAELYPD